MDQVLRAEVVVAGLVTRLKGGDVDLDLDRRPGRVVVDDNGSRDAGEACRWRARASSP
jgi:hypothetical protein